MGKDKTMLEQIKEFCTKNGITGYELAKHLPLSQVALQGILSGTTERPRIKNIKMIYDFLFKKDENNFVNEAPAIHETGHDKKIAEAEEKIEKIMEKISIWEEKLKKYPDKRAKYEGIIQAYEDQILIINNYITSALEARDDFKKHNK